MNPERDSWPSVRDPEAEQLLLDAALKGEEAVAWLDVYLTMADHQRYMDSLIACAVEAASLYHEALRVSGTCPMCGDRQRGYHSSLGCCLEPRPLTFDEALAVRCEQEWR
jgi:hypothetical protein